MYDEIIMKQERPLKDMDQKLKKIEDEIQYIEERIKQLMDISMYAREFEPLYNRITQLRGAKRELEEKTGWFVKMKLWLQPDRKAKYRQMLDELQTVEESLKSAEQAMKDLLHTEELRQLREKQEKLGKEMKELVKAKENLLKKLAPILRQLKNERDAVLAVLRYKKMKAKHDEDVKSSNIAIPDQMRLQSEEVILEEEKKKYEAGMQYMKLQQELTALIKEQFSEEAAYWLRASPLRHRLQEMGMNLDMIIERARALIEEEKRKFALRLTMNEVKNIDRSKYKKMQKELSASTVAKRLK